MSSLGSDHICEVAGSINKFTQKHTQEWAKKRNIIQLNDLTRSSWRSEQCQSISPQMIYLWNNYLSFEEQYSFFFEFMSSRERVRLWNSLVFPVTYFHKIAKTVKLDSRDNEIFKRDDLDEMCQKIQGRMKSRILASKGNGREIYTASVMRDLWE